MNCSIGGIVLQPSPYLVALCTPLGIRSCSPCLAPARFMLPSPRWYRVGPRSQSPGPARVLGVCPCHSGFGNLSCLIDPARVVSGAGTFRWALRGWFIGAFGHLPRNKVHHRNYASHWSICRRRPLSAEQGVALWPRVLLESIHHHRTIGLVPLRFNSHDNHVGCSSHS